MARRRSVNIQGFQHKNPVPNASRMGNTVMTGAILGRNTETGETPKTLEGRCELMFEHVRSIIEEAGGTTDDIIKMTVWMKDPAQRDAVNAEWTKMFPDPESRPARHTLPDAHDWPYLVSCDFTAIMGD